MFERLTDRSRRVIVTAQNDARARQHFYIDVEHLFVRIIADDSSTITYIRREFHLTDELVDTELAKIAPNGTQLPTGNLPFTPDAKRVLEYSLREALNIGQNFIASEHLLLGAIRLIERQASSQRVIDQLFAALSLDPEALRTTTLELSQQF